MIPFVVPLTFKSFPTLLFNLIRRKFTGFKTVIRILIIGATVIANFSGHSFARLFGVISPKTKVITVIKIVDTVAPFDPSHPTKRSVTIVVAAMFTTLFPTSVLEINSS